MIKMTKKQTYLVVLGAGLLVLVLYFVFARKANQPNPVFPAANEVSPATSSASGDVKKSTTKTSAPLSATQAYLDAVKIYKNSGYYFQFVDCHGTPGSLTLKAGKKFMLDNRDGKARKIAVQGGQSFNIGAYGFAIATAPSKIGTHYITCDGGGAAKIEVQK